MHQLDETAAEVTEGTSAGRGSHIDLRVERRGRTVKGRLLAALLRITGRPVFCGDLRNALTGLAAA